MNRCGVKPVVSHYNRFPPHPPVLRTATFPSRGRQIKVRDVAQFGGRRMPPLPVADAGGIYRTPKKPAFGEEEAHRSVELFRKENDERRLC